MLQRFVQKLVQKFWLLNKNKVAETFVETSSNYFKLNQMCFKMLRPVTRLNVNPWMEDSWLSMNEKGENEQIQIQDSTDRFLRHYRRDDVGVDSYRSII